MANYTLAVCEGAEELALEAAERITRAAGESVGAGGRLTLALAGGSTPGRTYGVLARPEMMARLDWSRAFVFFGDERCVPPDDPRSNYGMASKALLEHVPVTPDHVFPIPTDRTPAECARAYAATLASLFKPPAGAAPVFDLILLGLGDDGHTASLFPGMPSLQEREAWVVDSPPGVLPPPVARVTLTYPVLNAARRVLFLVSGEKKAAVLREVLEGDPSPAERPAAGVRPREGTVTWLVDAAAARLLARRG
jgi:6-phosphogluconolactonase